MRRRLGRSSAAAGLGALALLAGCGGEDEPAATQWADGLCTAITDWRTSVDETVAALRDGVTSRDDLREAADELDAATESLGDDLRGLGRPETESGEEAEAAVDELSTSVEDSADAVRSAVDGVSGLADLPGAASTVTTTLNALFEAVESTVVELQGLDPAGELEDAFRDADSCADLR
jgi:hypothetical protein